MAVFFLRKEKQMRYVLLLISLLFWACGGGPGTQPAAGVASVTVTPALDTLAPGQSAHFTAVLKDAAGHVLTGYVVWSSEGQVIQSDSIGPLGDFGVDVTAGSTAGTTFLYATSEGKVGKATIVVTAHDPYWGGILDMQRLGGVPNNAIVVIDNYVLRPSDSLPMYDTLTIKA